MPLYGIKELCIQDVSTVVQFVGKDSQDMTTYRDINATYTKMTNMFVLSVAKNLQEKTIFGVMPRYTRRPKRFAKGKEQERQVLVNGNCLVDPQRRK